MVAPGQMLAGIAAMQREQAKTRCQFLRALHDRAERQTFASLQIAARSAAAPPDGGVPTQDDRSG